MTAIKVQQLTKTFVTREKQPGLRGSIRAFLRPVRRETHAVKSITFGVEEGERVAFIGPNGAGKSTTIKMLVGILYPTSGQAQVLGKTPWRERKRLAYEIGTVFGQKSQLWYHLPPADSFDLLARIYELDGVAYRQRLAHLVELFEVGDYLQVPVRKLSLGERMRCEIAASLLHRPRILFLDEPTIGLDVVVKQRIRDLILELNQQEGVTIFLTSHDAVEFFPGVVRVLLYTLIPAAFVGSIPAGLLSDFDWVRLAALVAFTAGIALAAWWVFRWGLRRYESGNLVTVRG